MKTLRGGVILALITVVFSAAVLAQYSQPVRDVENPDRSPFFASGTLTLTAGGLSGSYGQQLATVPTGKRLTLDYISATCETASTDSITYLGLQLPYANMWFPVAILASRQGDPYGGVQRWVGSTRVSLYLDTTFLNSIGMAMARSNNAAVAACVYRVYGHTVSLP